MADIALQSHSTTNSSNEIVHRVPYAEISDLPEVLKPIATFASNKLDLSSRMELFRHLAVTHYSQYATNDKHSFVTELENVNIPESAKRRRSVYAGALWYVQGNSSQQDVYNPDKIRASTYERMQRDAQIALSLALIKKPIEHVNFSIDCESESVRAVVNWSLEKIYPRMIRDLLMGIDFGHSYLEKVWKKVKHLRLVQSDVNNTKEILYDREAWLLWTYAIHPSSYSILVDKYGELIGIKQQDLATGKSTIIKRSKLAVYVHDMQYGNWFGNSRLKNAYSWWYWGQIILQFMIRYLERKSSPPLVIKAPMGYGRDANENLVHNFALALKFGEALVSNSVGVIPKQYNREGKELWDIQYLMDDQRVFMFIEVLNFINVMISRSLMVPDTIGMQSSSGRGSYSQTDAHADVHFINEEALIRDLESVLNNDVVPDIVKINFPEEDRVPCRIKIEKLTLTRKQLLKEVFLKMIGVLNQVIRDGGRPYVLPDIEEICNILEIPNVDFDNVVDTSMVNNNSNNDESDDDKEEKIKENNKKQNEQRGQRKPRSRQERRRKIA